MGRRDPRVSPDKVEPGDPRYADLVRRGFNKRFAGKPDYDPRNVFRHALSIQPA